MFSMGGGKNSFHAQKTLKSGFDKYSINAYGTQIIISRSKFSADCFL